MRFILFIIFHVLFSMTAFSHNNTWCVLKLKDGVEQSYVVSGRMIVVVEGDSIRFESSPLTVSYSKHAVKSYYFRSDFTSDIPQVTDNGMRVEHLGSGLLVISGIPEGRSVKVYGINGIEYKKVSSNGGNKIHIDISSLPKGTYLIHLSGFPALKVVN